MIPERAAMERSIDKIKLRVRMHIDLRREAHSVQIASLYVSVNITRPLLKQLNNL